MKKTALIALALLISSIASAAPGQTGGAAATTLIDALKAMGVPSQTIAYDHIYSAQDLECSRERDGAGVKKYICTLSTAGAHMGLTKEGTVARRLFGALILNGFDVYADVAGLATVSAKTVDCNAYEQIKGQIAPNCQFYIP